MQIKFGDSKNSRIFAFPIREHSSVGLEHLPYKQRVGGSTPSAPTRKNAFLRCREAFFIFHFSDPQLVCAGLRGCWALLLLDARHLVKVGVGDHLAVAVKCRAELHRKLLDVEISVHDTTFLESQSILDEYSSVNLSPKIDILADNVTLDMG